MDKVRALFVCDAQLGERTKRIAEERGDVEVAVRNITYMELDKITSEINQNDYDILISRGEAIGVLSAQFDLPVIDIPVSEYDILKILRTVTAYKGKKALIFHYSMLGDIDALCELMQYKIDLFKIQTTQEGKEILKRLQAENYSLVIAGYTVVRAAKQMGMNAIAIQSGDASIHQCLNRAVNIVKQVRKLTDRTMMYESVIAYSGQYTVVLQKNGKRIYSNLSMENAHYDYVMDTISSLIQEAVFNKDAAYYREQDDLRWVFQSQLVSDEHNGDLIIFYVRHMPQDIQLLENVMTVRGTGAYFEPFLNPFAGNSKSVRTLLENARLYGQSDCSVLVVGNNGTGKGLLSEMLHMYSQARSSLLVKIFCELLSCEQLDMIFGEQSVFKIAERGTLILSNIHTLNMECQKKLYAYLSGDSRVKNFRLIVTTSCNLLERTESNQFMYKLYKKISELQIVMPSLQERAEDIESLASVLIGMFNQELATDVIGLEKRALELLKSFDWEFDIEQLKRVIRTLMLEASGPYITAEETARVLEAEKMKLVVQSSISKKVDFSGTLDEIMNSVVKAVLEEENMNQSQAAKRLGVSRSTIWRRLK